MPSDHAFVTDYLDQSRAALDQFAADPDQTMLLHEMTRRITAAFRAGGKLLLAGNGGSAGDAQHIAAEFTGRMLYTRGALPALALTTDTSALTAIGNDFGFSEVFTRQVEALGRPGDILLALSTSGRSANVLAALDRARAIGLTTFGFAGQDGGEMEARCDLLLRAPARFTPVVQQVHLVAAHIICALVERAMFPRG